MSIKYFRIKYEMLHTYTIDFFYDFYLNIFMCKAISESNCVEKK